MSAVPQYVVTLDTAQGRAVLEVPSMLGPDAASRRAFWTAVSLHWGDVDEVSVVSCEPMAPEEVDRPQ